jgi:ribosomal protein S18 acetylase RimI-like enzyme
MSTITISPVQAEELPELLQLARSTFYDAFAPVNTEENMRLYMDQNLVADKLAAELRNPESAFYFARAGDERVGYIKLNYGKAQTELRDTRAIEIERIYVKKEWQSRKIGQLLMDKALELARAHRAPYIWLGVFEANTKAIAFYQRNGFVAFSQHVFMLGTDEQRDIMMKRELL